MVDCTKGAASGLWVAAVEGIKFGRGGGRASTMVFVIMSPRRLWRWGGAAPRELMVDGFSRE